MTGFDPIFKVSNMTHSVAWFHGCRLRNVTL